MSKGLLLCIDDDLGCLKVRGLVFRSAGYDVLSVTSGRAGLAIFERTPVDMVVLDYSMPGLNGAEVAAMMRRMHPGVPILMLSGDYLEGDTVTEVDDCLPKTVDPGKLLSRIESLITLKRHPGHSCNGIA